MDEPYVIILIVSAYIVTVMVYAVVGYIAFQIHPALVVPAIVLAILGVLRATNRWV